MRLHTFLSKLINRYFKFNNEQELNDTIAVIVKGLKNLENSNVFVSNSMVVKQLNLIGKDKGLVFFEWDISTIRKLFYLITCRYPRMINLSIKGDMILLKVNNTKHQYLGNATKHFTVDDNLAKRLEIDISDNFIKFNLRGKDS